MNEIIGPIVEDLKRFKVIGWASEFGAVFDPDYGSNEPCPECEAME